MPIGRTVSHQRRAGVIPRERGELEVAGLESQPHPVLGQLRVEAGVVIEGDNNAAVLIQTVITPHIDSKIAVTEHRDPERAVHRQLEERLHAKDACVKEEFSGKGLHQVKLPGQGHHVLRHGRQAAAEPDPVHVGLLLGGLLVEREQLVVKCQAPGGVVARAAKLPQRGAHLITGGVHLLHSGCVARVSPKQLLRGQHSSTGEQLRHLLRR